MSDGIDRPTDVRDEERFDATALEDFLSRNIEGFEGPLTVRQFPSGFSNLTYALEDANGREFVMRRPPFGANVKSGHDMHREYRILDALHPALPEAPRPYVYTDDESIVGAPFYVMERVRGIVLRGVSPRVRGLDDPATMRGACEALVDTLVALHAVDLDACGLGDFGRPQGYAERQVSGWTRRWQKSMTEEVPQLDRAAAWLAANMPPEQPGTLIHNDFKYDNVVYAPDDLGKIIAVLDWEMATVGDPLMDLGTSLAYWIEEADEAILQTVAGPTALPGNLSRAQVAERYAEKSGRSLDDIVFYYVYGLFKVAVIGQQIFYRYHHGHTSDERFAFLIHLVRAIGERVEQTLERGTI